MIDLNSQFFAILTKVGEAKQANADALGIPWNISQMGVGDANDTDPIPDRLQTKLINERRRAPLNQLMIDPLNASVLIAEQVIPADVGGWWVREIGLYDSDGDLIAVANCAPSYKPLMSQGSGRTQIVRMNFVISSITNVVLKIDPAIVLATRDFVERSIESVLPSNKVAGTYNQVTINKRGVVVAGSNPTTLEEHGIEDAISSTPQFGIAGAIADVAKTTFGTYTSETTDKPPSSGWGVFLRIKYPGKNSAFDIAGDVSGGMDVLSFRRVLPNGSYVWRTVFHDGNFDPALKANLASPKFTGTPTAPTAPGDDYYGSQVANTAFVWASVNAYATTVSNALATKAPLESPAFTGTPTAPTAPAGSNYGQVANTAFVWASVNAYATTVNNALATKAPLESPAFTGTPTAPTAPAGSNYGEVANAAFVWESVNTYAATVTKALASKASIADTIPNRNPLPGGAIDIHGESFALVTSPHESCLAQNCYWNGADWVRHNPAQPAVCIAVGGGAAFVRMALPGVGPIVWAGSDTLWTASSATLTTSAGNATLRLPNGWIEQVFEVTESTGAADYRYFPVSFPNECFGVFPSLLSTTSGGYANNSGLVVGDVNKDRFLISAGGNFSPEGRMRVRALGR